MRVDRPGLLTELVGAGRSRLSLIGAMRARDVSRPSPAQLVAAETHVAATLAARLDGRVRPRQPGLPPRTVPAPDTPRVEPAAPVEAQATAESPGPLGPASGGSSPVRS